MAAKKPKKDDPVHKQMAQEAAAQKTRQYLRSPYNRAQVIMPPGKKYKPGTPDYVNKTKGRFRAAGQVYDRTYKEVLDFLNTRSKSKPADASAKKPKVSKAASKKK